MKGYKWIIILGFAIVSILLGGLIGEGNTQKAGIAILILAAGLWITEAAPLPVTALMIPVVASLSGIFSTREALSHFANPIIYVFIGGFTLAAVLSEHGIDRWIAGKVVRLTHGNRWLALVTMFGSVSFLSMWMSNTATTAMMLPIAMSLIGREYPRARVLAVLGTAYAANIGGIATVIGSPPNLIAAAALNIDFSTWIGFGLPVTILMFPIVIFVLKVVLKPEPDFSLNSDHGEAHGLAWSRGKSAALSFFLCVVCLWVLSQPISRILQVDNFDSLVAVAATVMAPVLGLTSWARLEKEINWGVLLLFGGGLCLSGVLLTTGTSGLIAEAILEGYAGDSGWLLIMIAVTFMIFLTEISSNTGSAAILVPIIMAVALEHNDAFALPMVMGIGIAANCAFMLPVATPPNALAFSTNEVTMKTMMRTGIILNIIAIPLIWGVVTLLS